jgi:hypothetical protein
VRITRNLTANALLWACFTVSSADGSAILIDSVAFLPNPHPSHGSSVMSDPKPPSGLPPIHTLVIEQLATIRIRQADRISITLLASQLGVSATPIREALSYLAGRDIVEERHRDGYFLAGLSSRDIADLYGLHGVCIRQMLQATEIAFPRLRKATNIWTLFDQLTEAMGSAALTAARRYVDARLGLVRTHEIQCIPECGNLTNEFWRAVYTQDRPKAVEISDLFHTRGQDTCVRMANLLFR